MLTNSNAYSTKTNAKTKQERNRTANRTASYSSRVTAVLPSLHSLAGRQPPPLSAIASCFAFNAASSRPTFAKPGMRCLISLSNSICSILRGRVPARRSLRTCLRAAKFLSATNGVYACVHAPCLWSLVECADKKMTKTKKKQQCGSTPCPPFPDIFCPYTHPLP